MGDAAGEGAHGLHLLRLAELVFETFFLGDVAGETAGILLAAELDVGGEDLDRELAAVLAAMDGLTRERSRPFEAPPIRPSLSPESRGG